MKSLRPLSVLLAVGCLAVGLLAALSGGGSVAQYITLGQSLIIAGAIIIAGALISSAIADSKRTG